MVFFIITDSLKELMQHCWLWYACIIFVVSFLHKLTSPFRVFKPLSAEGTYIGEILGKGKQKYFRLRRSVFGFKPKV